MFSQDRRQVVNEFAQYTYWGLIFLVVLQALLVAGFVTKLARRSKPLPSDDRCPPAAVVLCLRGSDPFLPQCVDAILRQDYPCYEVRVIVDHCDDPAWEVVTAAAQRSASRVSIQELARPKSTCSLKCSSLVQAVAGLDPTVEFIAQLDADVIPHPTWLRELAGALADPRVGAATGNRWYMPSQLSVGALVRCVWNAAAAVEMYSLRIAWGGTLAIKTCLLRETDLLERWSHAFCEDTMLFTHLRREGLKVSFVPSLLMVNRESCDLGYYFRWVRRQLLTVRLYHSCWIGVVGHATLTSLGPVLAVVVIGMAGFAGEWNSLRTTAAGLVIFQVSNALLIVLAEFAARRVIRRRGEPTGWLSFAGWLALFCMIPVTQVVHALALFSTMWLKRVEWRGVEYQINGPWEIHMLSYRPYVPPDAITTHDAHSI